MDWNLEGKTVEGMYLNFLPVRGTVELSRVAAGGRVKHLVLLDVPVSLYDTMREHVVMNHREISKVECL
jgi:hypothetical protein